MGINKINELIREHAPNAFTNIPLSKFCGTRIAIDATGWLFSSYSVAFKEIVYATDVASDDIDPDKVLEAWLRNIKRFLVKLLSHGINPMFIFDGQAPVQKLDTQNERKEKRVKAMNKYTELKENILFLNILDRTPDMINELRKCITQTSYGPPKEQTDIVKSVLSALNIPMIIAKGEGEQLCSLFAVEGIASAVFSVDTDNYVYGCPVLITGFGGYMNNPLTNISEESFSCVLLKEILDGLKLSFDSFKDLCIMVGCDYNTNIPRVGLKTSYKLIKEHLSIDNLPAKYDKTCLNLEFCRTNFTRIPSSDLYDKELSLDVRKIELNGDFSVRDFLELYKIENWLNDLFPLYHRLPKIQNVLVAREIDKSDVKIKPRLVLSEE